ncbi:NTP transferase domain-containing protein [Plantactinospora sp. S1510]|uniref:NTP transferase domain-containing protein n=2 Tax=Plantactinospora alkalitolerans TaxID=2789879 RepID=A0ABS0GQ01_9ACTN|nr:NTP transferase domain-containing protein [Plantactinospora alkalitolerans]
MRDRVLAAVADAAPRIVVGSTGSLPAGVRETREEPPGGGPVAATAAGLALVAERADPGTTIVALLAADLPLLTAAAVRDLRTALARSDTADGVVYLDSDERQQWLCGVWRLGSLRAALGRLAARHDGVLAGTSMRALMAELTVIGVAWGGAGPPPWFDCDTDDDLRRAEEWIR